MWVILKRIPAIDAIRSITLSIRFILVAEWDQISWSFLPLDYQEIIDRSEFTFICNNKK